MEISAQANVTPQQSLEPAIKAGSAPASSRRQDLPSPGSVMPPVEAKAPPKVEEFEPKDLAKAIEDLQSFVDNLGRDLNFTMDDQLNRSIITVRDANTSQVVRQIPGEELVAIARQINDSIAEIRKGLLMKGSA